MTYRKIDHINEKAPHELRSFSNLGVLGGFGYLSKNPLVRLSAKILALSSLLSNVRIELLKTRNQLHATWGRVESYRMKLRDSLLECPALSFASICKRGLVTRRWPLSASIRARRVLAIFHSRHYEINFSHFFKRRRRARIDAENGHRRVTRPRLRIIVKETRGYPTGYLRAPSDTLQNDLDPREVK